MKECAYCDHLALNFEEKIYLIPVLVKVLQALQYTEQNDPVSLSRPICVVQVVNITNAIVTYNETIVTYINIIRL